MLSLMIAVGALFVSVIVSVVIDPWPSGADGADDGVATPDAITLAV